ncbi:serine/threonine-protein kinase MST20-like isoform X2 [Magnolia sinica]|uniref:serine/threonine-protein kinase MST20-like isoform X2 n=1 Tax=Magnolia sinica TaxID=86752 RepID=UPI002657D7E6|nr:serine/threonine-protein kinase MST20-like isoform X2 [Magnolia sinica]
MTCATCKDLYGYDACGASSSPPIKGVSGISHRNVNAVGQLKEEERHCMEELQCNIVVMKRSKPKVLRLNLGGQHEPGLPFLSPSQSDDDRPLENRIKHSTPISSPEEPKPLVMRSVQASMSCRDMGNSPFFVCEQNPLFEGFRKGESSFREETVDWDDAVTSFGSDGEGLSPPSKHPLLETTHGRGYRESSTIDFERSQQYPSSHRSHKREIYWIPQNHVEGEQKNPVTRNSIATHYTKPPIAKTLLERFAEFDQEAGAHRLSIDQTPHRDYVFNSNVRDAVHLCRNSPSVPPPLCSICQHKVPVFGKPPRWFSYGELDEATDGFSEENFLAEGGFGSVHRGVLGDGQVVAVKQLKVASSQGDAEFCAEVEVLSCAQHRNVVMLIGFCIEEKRRVLVYEYICNGSLDFHLYEHNRAPLDWHARMKIAIGAARGLRYLHEDCRVGCIVHRDMRPNNILVTHDFEPLVGDFGLARWHPNGNLDVETHVIGTLGYLAPEYAESGRITEKTDVYAFGVVLLELITGQKAINMTRPKGQQFLVEWARPLLDSDEGQTIAIDQLLDPRLDLYELQLETHQLQAMAYAASLCLRRDPLVRPSMSKVLRVLEGDAIIDPGFDLDSVGNRTERMNGLILYRHASCNVDSVGTRSGRMNGLNLQQHASCDANSIGSRSERMNGLSLQQLIGFGVDSVSGRSRRMNCPSLQLHCSTTPDSIGNRSERLNNSRFQLQVEPREGHSRNLSLGTLKAFYAEKDSNHHGIY